MSAEINTYTRELLWIVDQVGHSVEGLTAQQLTWQPSIDTANAALHLGELRLTRDLACRPHGES